MENPLQKTPGEWEDLYLGQLLAYEAILESSLEPYFSENQLFDNIPAPQQWHLRNYLTEQSNHLELYNPTADWFVQRSLYRYINKLNEIKANVNSVLSLIANHLNNKIFPAYQPPFLPSPITPVPIQQPGQNFLQDQKTNQKMFEIMADLQKASFEHYNRMHEMQSKITDSINSYTP